MEPIREAAIRYLGASYDKDQLDRLLSGEVQPHPVHEEPIVRAFIAGAKSSWINANERVPESINKFFSDFVLVMYMRGGKPYPFITRYDHEYKMWEIENVTHWMPIPPTE